MLWPYSLKAFAEQFNVIKVDYDGITPIEKFSGTKTDLTLKNYHTWGFLVYVLYSIFQVNISGLTKWEPRSHAGMYIVNLPFYAGSVALLLNPSTVHVSPQFYAVFDDEFSTVPLMRYGIILPNWIDLVKISLQSIAP